MRQGSVDVDGLKRRIAPENFVAAKPLGQVVEDDGHQHPGALGADLSPTNLGVARSCANVCAPVMPSIEPSRDSSDRLLRVLSGTDHNDEAPGAMAHLAGLLV